MMKATVIPRSMHTVSRNDISRSALKVLYRLNEGGYQAYLVGGSVRDILLGKHPKDFDVATDATPEEVKKLFSNSIIIGKRFRLVHVRYGHDIIEVATFRSEHTKESGVKHQETGMILRDNVYGELEDDVMRRDFTVNALYYNIADFSIVDYVGGMEDINQRSIHMIGEPEQRFTEDPVRMLRGIRLAAKLDLGIEKHTANKIKEMRNFVEHVSPARLFDEITKMSLCGHMARVYALLKEYGLFEKLFPLPDSALKADKTGFSDAFVIHALEQTDARIAGGKTINPAFLMAVFFWVPLQQRVEYYVNKGEKLFPALIRAEAEIIQKLAPILIPKRLLTIIRDIWRLQYHLKQVRRNRIYRCFYHARFRAAYDFLLIRNQGGEDLNTLCDFWTEFQEADHDDQERLISQLQKQPGVARGPHNRRKKKESAS